MHERIVSKDNVVQWEGRRFQIPPTATPLQLRRSQSAASTKASMGSVSLYYGQTRLQHSALPGE